MSVNSLANHPAPAGTPGKNTPVSTAIIRLSNRVFKETGCASVPSGREHRTAAERQFDRGLDGICYFLDRFTLAEMFAGRRVLDMGCGAAGKSLYYAAMGAAAVTGVDVDGRYEREARALAEKLGLAAKFRFLCADALAPGLPPESFDTVMMTDFLEHVSDPGRAVETALGLLAPGGRLFITLPPYGHPYGAHMADAIRMPWVQLFFTEPMLINAYKAMVRGRPDEKDRISRLFTRDATGHERFTYVNKLSLRRFKALLRDRGLHPCYYREVPLRGFLSPVAKLPLAREMTVKTAVCVISK